MNVIVFNCGSSSLKYRVIDMPSERELAGGEAQRVGPPTAEPSRIFHHGGGKKEVFELPMRNHGEAFEEVMKILKRDPKLMPELAGHRVVHGANIFKDSALMDAKSLAQLESLSEMAPLHNPPAVSLIKAVAERSPELPQVAVFDTAFHASIPEYARTYPLPRRLREDMLIRKYGFHGTSHQFVAEEAAKLLGKPLAELNAVSCHLGSGGASLCAIVKGRSVDNTMGYSPLQGLVMSTRCGDLDPGAALTLLSRASGKSEDVERLLNNRSGVLGLSSGRTADIRDVFSEVPENEADMLRKEQTEEVYLWRIRKYLGAYLAVVPHADAIIFTDTIGENVPQVRWAVSAGLECFGVKMDVLRNESAKTLPVDISAADSRVKMLVIATNEELAIARRSYLAINAARRKK